MKLSSMPAKALIIFWGLLISSCSTSPEKVSQTFYAQHTETIYAIVNVNLITMETDVVIPRQTVIVRDERIVEIGDADEISVPESAQIIPGEGKYLLPGFIDMHVHISEDADLLKFLNYGITTVRHMSDVPSWAKFMGFPDILSLRKKQQQSEILGPDIYTCGFTFDGDPPVSPMNKKITSPQEAQQEIKKEYHAGYDCIKIYDKLSPEVFDAIVNSANEYKMPVVGHVPFQVGIDHLLQSSVVSIEHLTGYIDNNSGTFLIPEDRLEEYAVKTKQSGIYNCPTLVIWDNLPPKNQMDVLENDPDYRYLPWHIQWLWKRSVSYVYETSYPDETRYAEHMMEISKKMLLALYESECPLLIGTDANFVGVYPGSSALREMELFSEAGIPHFDILKSATLTAAKALNREHEIGTLAKGKIANMVLLAANPLADIRNIYHTSGVFIRGQWLSKEDVRKIQKLGFRSPTLRKHTEFAVS